MDREQQIRSKAKELGQQYFPDSSNIWARGNIEAEYIESACIEIAEWLDQHPHWIPVEEELPPLHYEGANSTDFVLIWDGDDALIAYYNFKEKKWYNEEYGALIIPATHWMPIVPPRKED